MCFAISTALLACLFWNVLVVWTYPAFQGANLLDAKFRTMLIAWSALLVGGVVFAVAGAAVWTARPRYQN